jgi:hypothetical protein
MEGIAFYSPSALRARRNPTPQPRALVHKRQFHDRFGTIILLIAAKTSEIERIFSKGPVAIVNGSGRLIAVSAKGSVIYGWGPGNGPQQGPRAKS